MKRGVLFDGFKTPKVKDKEKIKKLVAKTKNPKSRRGSSRNLSIDECVKRVREYSLRVAERLPEYTFDLITDEETLNNYLEASIDNGVLSLDTETTGLDKDDKVVGICIYTPGMNPSYVPYNHLNYEYNVNVKPFLEEVMKLSQEEKLIVPMAKATYDQRKIKDTFEMDDYIRCLWDVQIAGKFLNENLRKYGLKILWEYYVMKTPYDKIKPDDYKSLFGSHSFDEFNPEDVITYPALDGLMTHQVYEFQYEYLGENGKYTDKVGLRSAVETHKMWSRLIEVVSGMMDNGVNIEDEAIQELGDLLQAQAHEKHLAFDSAVDDVAEEFLTPLMNNDPELFSKIERPLNPASPAQLSILFYDAMHLHQYKKRSVDESVVERLLKKYPQYAKMFNALMDYRKVQKLLSTYVEGLQKRKNEKTGKIHTHFKIYGARTGRYSSSDPNLQNIPVRTELGRQIRRTFVPSEGHYFIGSDYSQQEPRLLAFASGDKNMINAYLSGKDIYATTAALVYNVPYEHCLESYGKEGKKRRTSMKSVILGIMYYRGANSIAEELGISPGAAKSIISKFYQNFPTIKQYVDDSINFCYKNGYVKTVWGRKIRIPELQLPPYEYTSKLKLDAETKQQIEADLSNIWNRDKKRERISWYKKNYGIKIKDNTGRIHAAKRQVVNSIIQGNCIALTY